MKKLLLLCILCFSFLTPLFAVEKVDLGKVDYISVAKEYSGFHNTFEKGLIGIPAGIGGLKEPFYGTFLEAKEQVPNAFKEAIKLPVVFYMEGSGPFSKAHTFREWVTGTGRYIFFAPNSYGSEDRPTYSSPVPKEIYEKVHEYRQAEIQYALSRFDEIPFIDTEKMFLMGNSEGALAAARYSGKEFKARIVLSWTCEPGYYTDFPKVGSSYSTDPFLNIVGRDDAYFGKFSSFNKQYNIEGHCGDALFRYKHAKVVLLPNTGHNVMTNPYTKGEILSFISMWKNVETK